MNSVNALKHFASMALQWKTNIDAAALCPAVNDPSVQRVLLQKHHPPPLVLSPEERGLHYSSTWAYHHQFWL